MKLFHNYEEKKSSLEHNLRRKKHEKFVWFKFLFSVVLSFEKLLKLIKLIMLIANSSMKWENLRNKWTRKISSWCNKEHFSREVKKNKQVAFLARLLQHTL